jgi:hypothetical protein
VSSSDKPSSGTVKGTHDESEKRLKYEVMQISRRERKRLKTIPAAEPGDSVGISVSQEYIDARRVKQPESGPVGGNQGGGFGKTSMCPPILIPFSSMLTFLPQTGTSKSANATHPPSSPKPTNSLHQPQSPTASSPHATSSASRRAMPPIAQSTSTSLQRRTSKKHSCPCWVKSFCKTRTRKTSRNSTYSAWRT